MFVRIHTLHVGSLTLFLVPSNIFLVETVVCAGGCIVLVHIRLDLQITYIVRSVAGSLHQNVKVCVFQQRSSVEFACTSLFLSSHFVPSHDNMFVYFSQLVDIFGGLLERPIIKEIFDPYYPRLVTMMDEELDSVKLIYDWQMEKIANDSVPPVHKNFPKVCLQ